MSRILITGGCGFVGSNLAVHLARSGTWSVTCLDNLSRRGSEVLCRRVQENGCAFVRGDIRNPEDLDGIEGDVDVIVECSAEPSVLAGTRGEDAKFVLDNNLVGALNCFEFARKRRCGVIFLSTSRVYPYDYIGSSLFKEESTRFVYDDHRHGITQTGVSIDCPLQGVRSLYGATKLAAEYILTEYAFNYDIPAIIDRCGVIAGPWQLGKVDQGVFTFWLANHYFNRPLNYIGYGGSGKQVRDVLHIEDLIDLLIRQLDVIHDFRGQIFNVGGGRNFSLSLCETTDICRELTGNHPEIGSTKENRPADVCWYVTDNGDTLETFNWKPAKTPQQVLADTFHWLKSHETEFAQIFNYP